MRVRRNLSIATKPIWLRPVIVFVNTCYVCFSSTDLLRVFLNMEHSLCEGLWSMDKVCLNKSNPGKTFFVLLLALSLTSISVLAMGVQGPRTSTLLQ